MKNLVISVYAVCALVCCLCFSSESYCDEDSFTQNAFEFVIPNVSGDKDYQQLAKFFGIYMCPANPGSEALTNIFSTQGGEYPGIIFHVGWYADGYIITQINGSNKGYQVVVWKDETIGISYPSSLEVGFVINKYSFGVVYTNSWQQEIVWNK